MPCGFFGIGIAGGKNHINVGTLWRSATVLGAGFVFTAGARYPKQAADTVKSWRHLPFFEFSSADDLFEHLPRDCVPVAIELDQRGTPLDLYVHPARACYILGAEDTGLAPPVLDRSRDIVQLPGESCLNVAVAGSIVMYDRLAKQAARLEFGRGDGRGTIPSSAPSAAPRKLHALFSANLVY